MKHLICLLSLAIATNIKAQTFEELIKKADSLKAIKNYSESLNNFQEAIHLVLTDQVVIGEDKWRGTLFEAATVADIVQDNTLSASYWRMVQGNHGEKLDEKLKRLQERKIENIVSYNTYSRGDGFSIFIGGCGSNETRYLLWQENKTWYVQKFQECFNYKDFAFPSNSGILFKKRDFKKIKEEEIRIVNEDFQIHHSQTHVLEIHHDSKTVKKVLDENWIESQHPRIKNHPTYLQNRDTKLYKLLQAVLYNVSLYEKKLNSSNERKMVGKL